MIKYRGVYNVFLRTAQGSRGAPLYWSVIVSLLARVVQSLFCSKGTQTARLQVYVDDPLLALQGTTKPRRAIAVKFVACWLILGVELALSKAQLDKSVTWIGNTIAAEKNMLLLRSLTRK